MEAVFFQYFFFLVCLCLCASCVVCRLLLRSGVVCCDGFVALFVVSLCVLFYVVL